MTELFENLSIENKEKINSKKIKLKHILEKTKYNHKIEIVKQFNLKEAHMYLDKFMDL